MLQLQQSAGRRITNVVYMGMGEPLLNYDSVFKSARLLTNDRAIAIGARHVTISTAGIPEGILRLARESLKVKLALSLHSLDDSKRAQIMPITKNILSRSFSLPLISTTGQRAEGQLSNISCSKDSTTPKLTLRCLRVWGKGSRVKST